LFFKLTDTSKIVVHLVSQLPHNWHHIFVDNYYSDPALCQYLYDTQKTLVTGTWRIDKGVPNIIKLQKTTSKAVLQQEKLNCNLAAIDFESGLMFGMSFYGTRGKPVYMLSSSKYKFEIEEGGAKKVERFDIVHSYNRNMGGNDQLDAVLSHYSVYIRSKRWTMRIASWAIDVAYSMSYLNARLLQVPLAVKKNGHVNWMISLINELIKKSTENHSTENSNDANGSNDSNEEIVPEPPKKKSKHSDNSLRLSTNPPHFLTKLQKNNRKECVLCYLNSKYRKKTYYECDQCGVGLCIECFKLYHTKTAL